MKCKVKAKELQSAIKAALAIHTFGESKDRQTCDLTVTEAGLYCRSAKLGAFLVQRIDCQLLREGAVGVDAKEIDELKLKGEVTLDVQDTALIIQGGRVRYTVPLDSTVQQDLDQQYSLMPDLKAQAAVPTTMMSGGAAFTTWKSDTVKSDFDVQITIANGAFEYAGIDHVAMARYYKQDETVKAKQPVKFVLGASLIHKIIGEVQDEQLRLAVSDDGAIVKLYSPDGRFILYHPTVDKNYIDLQGASASVRGGTLNCGIKMQHTEFRRAVDALGVVAKKTANGVVEIGVAEQGCAARIQAGEHKGHYDLGTEEHVGAGIIKIQDQYWAGFAKVAPNTLLQLESWDNTHLRIAADAVEYLVLQAS